MPRRSTRRASGAWIAHATVIALALAALVVPLPPHFVETYYSTGLYPRIQRPLTTLSNLVPFALLDVAAALAIVVWLRRITRSMRGTRRWPAAGRLVFEFAAFTAVLYLVFLCLWGLNYRRVPLEEKVEFDAARITREAAMKVGAESVRLVNTQHAGAHDSTEAGPDLTEAFAAAQKALGARTLAQPGRPKRSLLGFYFRWAAIDGMTNPYFLEVIVNPDVLPIERPFVVAHEWAHLAGFADESEANFVAWLTCARGNAQARYSGWLALYAHISNALSRSDRVTLAEQLGAGPRADLQAINARLLRSAPVVRNAARDVYDSYLKANRVERGIESYDAVVRLVLGSTFDEDWKPRMR
jgi:hypothetical protein